MEKFPFQAGVFAYDEYRRDNINSNDQSCLHQISILLEPFFIFKLSVVYFQ